MPARHCIPQSSTSKHIWFWLIQIHRPNICLTWFFGLCTIPRGLRAPACQANARRRNARLQAAICARAKGQPFSTVGPRVLLFMHLRLHKNLQLHRTFIEYTMRIIKNWNLHQSSKLELLESLGQDYEKRVLSRKFKELYSKHSMKVFYVSRVSESIRMIRSWPFYQNLGSHCPT